MSGYGQQTSGPPALTPQQQNWPPQRGGLQWHHLDQPYKTALLVGLGLMTAFVIPWIVLIVIFAGIASSHSTTP
jgi:hypothetical protein